MQHSSEFIQTVKKVCDILDRDKVERFAEILSQIKGRLFILGVGGSAANASHAVNDFRKLCGIEAYAPTDNVAELTARTNDEGWATIFREWLITSKLNDNDVLLVLSVGGGTLSSSPNIMDAIFYAKEIGAKTLGIIGREHGYTAANADIAILVPIVEDKWVTPLSEAFQMVILHCLVSHPLLQKVATKW